MENNRLSTALEQNRIKELVKKGVATEAELSAAACALHKCSEQYVEGTEDWIKYKRLEELGNSLEYTGLREQLANERFVASYIDHETGEKIDVIVASLFQYSNLDKVLDNAVYIDGKYQLTERGVGLLQAGTGAAEIIGGTLSCSNPLACAAGAVVATSGLDNLHAGSQTVISGNPTKTMGAAGLEALGVPAEYSEIAYATVGLGGATTIVLKSPSGKLVQVMVSGENKVAKTTIDSLPSSQPNHSVAEKGTTATQLTIDKNKFAAPDFPGVSQSRVNVANVTYDNGKVRGFEYAMGKHGADASVPNKSRFVIANDEVKVLLQRPDVVNKPVYNPIQIGGKIETNKFVRQVDVGKTIGVDQSGKKTSVITIITDRKGNLINTFPGKL